MINNKKNGYTLLFAVITAILVLSVTSFILGVSRKQYILSSTAKDSNIAFYNADSGVECVFGTIGVGGIPLGQTFTASCAGQNITFPEMNVSEAINKTSYVYTDDVLPGKVTFSNGCALIYLKQGYLNIGTVSNPINKVKVIILSRGYNQCSSGDPIISPRTVERAVELQYVP
jgi:hypothetical protein